MLRWLGRWRRCGALEVDIVGAGRSEKVALLWELHRLKLVGAVDWARCCECGVVEAALVGRESCGGDWDPQAE